MSWKEASLARADRSQSYGPAAAQQGSYTLLPLPHSSGVVGKDRLLVWGQCRASIAAELSDQVSATSELW